MPEPRTLGEDLENGAVGPDMADDPPDEFADDPTEVDVIEDGDI